MAQTLTIPDGVTVHVQPGVVTLEGSGHKVVRAFDAKVLKVAFADGTLTIEAVGKETRTRRAAVNAILAHAKNALAGFVKPHEKKLSVVFAHFPITLEVKGREVLIKNFLGEKNPRRAKIEGDAKVEVKGADVTVTGADRESVGQTANNIARAMRVGDKDPRVFQDGAYYA